MSDDDTENSGTENNVSEAPASTPSEGIMGKLITILVSVKPVVP